MHQLVQKDNAITRALTIATAVPKQRFKSGRQQAAELQFFTLRKQFKLESGINRRFVSESWSEVVLNEFLAEHSI